MAPVTSKKRSSTNAKNDGSNKKTKIVKKDHNITIYSSEESDIGSDESELDLEMSSSSEEDELDQSSEEEDALDNAEEDEEAGNEDKEDSSEEDEKDNAKEAGTSSSAAAHAEQKKLLKERKLKRSSGEEISQIKNLWEKLRVQNTKVHKSMREKLSNEIWELSKDRIGDMVMKHDASRIVQTLVKYSSKERREKIIESLKGKYYALATSSYGKYLMVKLLHYGSKQSRQIIIDELHGNLRKLMRHKEGAYVVEDLYVLYASQDQRNQMIREFWGSEYAVFANEHKNLTVQEVCATSVEKRNIIAKNLIGTITASVEKGSAGFQILHAAMREYVNIADDKEISEFIELMTEHFAELVHTPEGSDVACTLIARANAKERKNILRTLKDHAENLIKNEHGNNVFITLLMCVDDTVLMGKTFSPLLKEKLQEFVVDKFARRPFLYLLLGLSGRYFSPIIKKDLEKYIELSKTTSKKPFDQRRFELLSKFAPVMLATYNEHYQLILCENVGAQFVTELLVNDDVYSNLGEKDVPLYNECLQTSMTFFKGDIMEDEHPINIPFCSRFLKSLIQGGKWNPKEKKMIPLHYVKGLGPEFAVQLYDNIIDITNLEAWCNNPNSSFIVVALFETLQDKPEGADFIKDLKSVKKNLAKEDSENKGRQLLLKLMA